MLTKEKAVELGIPVVPAYRDSHGNFWTFCKSCGYCHQHGDIAGPKVAHDDCSNVGPRSQYFLEDMNAPVSKEMIRADKIGKALFEKKWRDKKAGKADARKFRFSSKAEVEESSTKYWSGRGDYTDTIVREIIDYGILGDKYPFKN
jgi:hypothetical protein